MQINLAFHSSVGFHYGGSAVVAVVSFFVGESTESVGKEKDI